MIYFGALFRGCFYFGGEEMLIVTDLDYNSEPLTDYSNLSIKQKINEDYTLSFTVSKTENNKDAYELVQEEAKITYDCSEFIIKKITETPYGKSVIATHEFFEMADTFVEETLLEGMYTIQQALQHAFSTSTRWEYDIEGTFEQVTLTDFGNDNCLALVQQIMQRYNAEFEFDEQHKRIVVKNRIGEDTDYQIRYRHNLKTISKSIDSSNMKNAVKVYFNVNDLGEYRSSFLHTTPNANKYGRKYAEPLYLDEITSFEEARRIAENYLKDVPDISIECEFVELQKAGYQGDVQLGNSLFLIDERMGIDIEARIVEIEEYPESSKSPRIVISNAQKTMTDVVLDLNNKHANLDRVAVKQRKYYNGCTITPEEGFKATSQNGVTVWMNATEGFILEKDGIRKFFVDQNGKLQLDGELHITSDDGNKKMLEAFLEESGGTVKIYNADGIINAQIGSNIYSHVDSGGAVYLYSDNGDLRVDLFIDRATESGRMTLRDRNGESRININADSTSGAIIRLSDANGDLVTYLTEDRGVIGNERIATRDWVRDYVDDILSGLE